jgi:propionate catabolism operon transcriptional regulator
VDVRVISSTHKDLRREVQAGRFRKDLYYRLAVLRLNIPPLRRRLEDIPELLAPLLKRYKKPLSCITPAMFERIRSYHWPGNIRELKSLMESYLILLGSRGNDERLFLELFEEYGDPASPPVGPSKRAKDRTLSPAADARGDENDSRTLAEQMEDHKRNLIRQTLHRCGNNKTLAAKRLGISTNTLWRALKRGPGLFA